MHGLSLAIIWPFPSWVLLTWHCCRTQTCHERHLSRDGFAFCVYNVSFRSPPELPSMGRRSSAMERTGNDSRSPYSRWGFLGSIYQTGQCRASDAQMRLEEFGFEASTQQARTNTKGDTRLKGVCMIAMWIDVTPVPHRHPSSLPLIPWLQSQGRPRRDQRASQGDM